MAIKSVLINPLPDDCLGLDLDGHHGEPLGDFRELWQSLASDSGLALVGLLRDRGPDRGGLASVVDDVVLGGGEDLRPRRSLHWIHHAHCMDGNVDRGGRGGRKTKDAHEQKSARVPTIVSKLGISLQFKINFNNLKLPMITCRACPVSSLYISNT